MKVQTASSPLFFNPQYIPFMKKNITINLFGTLYAIDEDACQLLEQYLDNMKSYFSRREGGDEIADDIEHRVAEIFSDLKAQGTEAISMENVQDIIRRIGNPEQMDSDADMDSHDDSADAGCRPVHSSLPNLPVRPMAVRRMAAKRRIANCSATPTT